MRLHDRYLFRELLTPLAYSLGGFLVFWISFFFFKQLETIQEKKLNLFDTAEYCAASLPEFFVLVLPILLLLALLYALTQHARHHEITALRAAGVGLWRVCAPYFIVGLLATAFYFALNEIAVPQGTRWANDILNRHVKSETDSKHKTWFAKGFYNLQAHRVWQFGEYDAVTTRMLNPTVTWTLPDGSWHGLVAGSAVYTNGVWTFYNAHLKFKQSGPPGEPVPTASTNILAMPEFDETPAKILLLLKFSDTQDWRDLRGENIPLAELWACSRSNSGIAADKARALLTEFHARLAAPWTCLVVVLMAIPFGVPAGRRNLFFGVAGSIFICFAYFVLQRVSLAFGTNGHLPGWLAAWLPNLIFAGLGIILTLRAR